MNKQSCPWDQGTKGLGTHWLQTKPNENRRLHMLSLRAHRRSSWRKQVRDAWHLSRNHKSRDGGHLRWVSNEETGVKEPGKYIRTTLQMFSSRGGSHFSRDSQQVIIFFNCPLLNPPPIQVGAHLESVPQCVTQITGHLELPGTSPTQGPSSHSC